VQNELIPLLQPDSGCTKNISTSDISGNKCGHRPDAPRFFSPPEKHANRPEILRRTQIAIQEYYRKPGTLPLLNAANGSTRQQRSERREACIDLLCCIMHFTDLVTLRVAIPQDNAAMGFTMPYLAKLSGLGERRAERAIHDLKAAGIITVHPICVKLADTAYKGLAAIRTVSHHLFAALGFGDWLKHERRKATERKLQRSEKKRRKELANVQMSINAAKPKATAPVKRTGSMSSVADHLANIRAIFKPPPD
jgi:hypothetical protein